MWQFLASIGRLPVYIPNKRQWVFYWGNIGLVITLEHSVKITSGNGRFRLLLIQLTLALTCHTVFNGGWRPLEVEIGLVIDWQRIAYVTDMKGLVVPSLVETV